MQSMMYSSDMCHHPLLIQTDSPLNNRCHFRYMHHVTRTIPFQQHHQHIVPWKVIMISIAWTN